MPHLARVLLFGTEKTCAGLQVPTASAGSASHLDAFNIVQERAPSPRIACWRRNDGLLASSIDFEPTTHRYDPHIGREAQARRTNKPTKGQTSRIARGKTPYIQVHVTKSASGTIKTPAPSRLMAGGSELGQVLHANNGHREGSSPLPASRRFSPGKGRAALLQIPRIRAEVLRVGQVARPLRVDAKRPEPRQQEVVERSDKRHVGPAEGEGHPRHPDDGVDDGDAEEGFGQAACVAARGISRCGIPQASSPRASPSLWRGYLHIPLGPEKGNLWRLAVVCVKVYAKLRVRVPSLLAADGPEFRPQFTPAPMDKHAECDCYHRQLEQEGKEAAFWCHGDGNRWKQPKTRSERQLEVGLVFCSADRDTHGRGLEVGLFWRELFKFQGTEPNVNSTSFALRSTLCH